MQGHHAPDEAERDQHEDRLLERAPEVRGCRLDDRVGDVPRHSPPDVRDRQDRRHGDEDRHHADDRDDGDHRLRHVPSRVVHLLRDRAGGLEAEERPAHDGDGAQPADPEPVEATVRPVERLEQGSEPMLSVEEEEGDREPDGRRELGNQQQAHEHLEDRLGDAVDGESDEGDDRGDPDVRGLGVRVHAEPRKQEARRRVRAGRHRERHRPPVRPCREPARFRPDLLPGPLVDAPRQGVHARDLAEHQHDQELTRQDDEQSPEEARARRGEGEREHAVERDDQRCVGEAQREGVEETELPA